MNDRTELRLAAAIASMTALVTILAWIFSGMP